MVKVQASQQGQQQNQPPPLAGSQAGSSPAEGRKFIAAPPDIEGTTQEDFDEWTGAYQGIINHPLKRDEFVTISADGADIDRMIAMYEELDNLDKRIYQTKVRLREALSSLTEGDAKTRRVRGRTRTAKITMPDDSWDQSVLKEAWNSFPELADGVLGIATLRVKLREYKKLVNTAGDPAFTMFRDMVTSANRGPVGTPTVKVES